MELNVTLSGSDVRYLDAYAQAHQLDSRAAALRHAIRKLQMHDLEAAYTDAWAESDSAQAWDATFAGDL